MPKQRKYPWYAARECYRKQVTLPDKTVRTLYAKTEEEMDAKLAELRLQIEANAIARSNPTVGQYAIEWFNLNTGGCLRPGSPITAWPSTTTLPRSWPPNGCGR